MPQRSFKNMFVELVSFLTLFTLVGTMSSNFWERYLIQSELSNMKSSLHVLKETIYNIGTAYDNLNHELKGLVEIKEIKSLKSTPRGSKLYTNSKHRTSNDLNVFSNNVMEELIKLKANKSIGITASKGTSSPSSPKEIKFAGINEATITRNPLKSTGVNSELENVDTHTPENINDENNNNDENNCKANDEHTQIHKCFKESNCCKYSCN